RHTRFKCDWSSDVCSSDLLASDTLFVYVDTTLAQRGWALQQQKDQEARAEAQAASTRAGDHAVIVGTIQSGPSSAPVPVAKPSQIGRASCREGVCGADLGG